MPCTRKRASCSLSASRSKMRMNSRPIVLRFSSGSVMPASAEMKWSCARTCTRGTPKWLAEGLLDLLALVQAHQPVVDEDAGEAVADRLVHDQRRDGAVDAAGEAADRAGVADLARTRSTCSSMTCVAVQVGVQSQASNRNHLSRSVPKGVWTTSGWNWTP